VKNKIVILIGISIGVFLAIFLCFFYKSEVVEIIADKDNIDQQDVVISKRNLVPSKKLSLSKKVVSSGFVFQPINIDDLLDEDDKTEINNRFIRNHNNLLDLSHKLNNIYNKKNKAQFVTLEEIKQWVQVLINDVYFTNEYYLKHDIQINTDQIDFYNPALIPRKNEVSPRIEQGHLKALEYIVKTIGLFSTTDFKEGDVNKLMQQISPLLKKSRQQSRVFYSTLMRKYFQNEDYLLQDKINFSRSFINAGDKKLMKYSLQFFKGLLGRPIYKSSKSGIQQFIQELTVGLAQ